ncbi:MAG: Uma2 family endonuclease [Lamprobacter sp.]|uniref:Uma2 family endonuclease n=1 Tax=Lamprobacter sp. TaxID=3100796 RepID=UPI002B2593FE|nr:Uma2 family endonuclease [Lamprobacter sp.]MEA3641833.1 Uma2 family endonuclease [Lamprobacter sp.]
MSQVVRDLTRPTARQLASTELTQANAALEPYDGMQVSEAEYWRCYADWPDVTFEWHDGRLEAKGVSDWATILVFQWFTGLIRYFLDSHGGGQFVNQELGFSFSLTTQETRRRSIRRPDTAVILPDNPHQLQPSDRTYQGVFDLCLEALSDSDPNQKARDQVTKVREYAQAGVAEYYILAANLRDCAFYRRDTEGRYTPLLPDQDGVMASASLPGLRWRWRDLARQPSLEALLADPVYQGYVLPEFNQSQADKAAALQRAEQEARRADQESRRAEQEARRADQEAARAERLSDRLRQFGIDPLD